MSELKPCPFCGSEAEYKFLNDLGVEAARCNKCQITISLSKWNSRYYPEGCTPEDAMQLREANHALAAEKETVESLLTTAMELIREQGFEDEFFIRRGKLTQ